MMFQTRGIGKSYGTVQVLGGVSLEFRPGEVHAILGANGAGKSTLMKMLAGAEQPTAGDLLLDGEPVHFADTRAASARGVAWVAQELTVFEHLDVLENLFLGREPRTLGVMRRARMRRAAGAYLEMVGLPARLSGPVGELSLAERQRIEIARALLQRPRVLILDEPTSALDAAETERLMAVVRRLRADGVAIILVSHFLEDVFAVADVVTVLRDGAVVVAAEPVSHLSQPEVVDAMLGDRRPLERRERERVTSTARALEVRGLAVDGIVDSVDLTVGPSEIVALVGLEGSGHAAILEVLSGRLRPDRGSARLPTGGGVPRSLADAARRGIALVPADRARVGIFADRAVQENIAAVRTLALGREGMLLRRRRSERRALERIGQLDIRPARPDVPVGALSGGNQQKVVLAKWLEADPEVYLLDDPTRGVDVHTRALMHQSIRDAADRGARVLIASSDLDELCEVADRALVFFRGQVTGHIPAASLSPHVLLSAMNTGVTP